MILDWSHTRFAVWLVVEIPNAETGNFDPITLDIIDVSMTYRLNDIPEADLGVAIGFEAESGELAEIHNILESLVIPVKAQIWIAAKELRTSTAMPIAPWPIDIKNNPLPFVAFEGYVTAIAFDDSRDGGAAFRMRLKNWLADLDFSSTVSRTSNVTNPSHYYNPAALGVPGAGANFTATTTAGWAFDPNTVLADMWANVYPPNVNNGVPTSVIGDGAVSAAGLLGYMLKLTEQDILQIPELGIQPNGLTNIEARNALLRFEPYVDSYAVNGVTLTGYRYGRPLTLKNLDFNGAQAIARVIAQDVASESIQVAGASSIWDKLINSYSPNYLCAVVPMAQRALFVPITIGLRQPWATITKADYSKITDSMAMIRPLRGLALMTGMGSAAGGIPAQPGVAAATAIPTIGGYYQNPNQPLGTIMFGNAPSWLARVQATDVHGFRSVGPGYVTGNAVFPGQGQAGLENPNVAQASNKFMIDAMARSMYIREALFEQSIIINGRPRFDIAPGSSVVVETSDITAGRNHAGSYSLVYGTVSEVTIGFNAGGGDSQPSAYGNIIVVATRSEVENTDDSLSTSDNPLWTYTYRGAPLVDLPVFGLPLPMPWEI